MRVAQDIQKHLTALRSHFFGWDSGSSSSTVGGVDGLEEKASAAARQEEDDHGYAWRAADGSAKMHSSLSVSWAAAASGVEAWERHRKVVAYRAACAAALFSPVSVLTVRVGVRVRAGIRGGGHVRGGCVGGGGVRVCVRVRVCVFVFVLVVVVSGGWWWRWLWVGHGGSRCCSCSAVPPFCMQLLYDLCTCTRLCASGGGRCATEESGAWWVEVVPKARRLRVPA
jgi:hypothetical protein